MSLLQDLEKLDPTLEVMQAKQKFGELRVYLKTGLSEAYDLIDAATRGAIHQFARSFDQRLFVPLALR